LKAYKHLLVLRAALAAHQSKYVTQRVEHDATPHSIIPGDACFAYFNKIWGIPGAVTGKVANLASRLCDQAKNGQILIDINVFSAIKHWRTRHLQANSSLEALADL
jgi:hypothetical protein